jgi:hypothetical protein
MPGGWDFRPGIFVPPAQVPLRAQMTAGYGSSVVGQAEG